ncbi:AAA family ATPase [Nocardiopsis aegyptia]|uniref:helix-turn-helix transcriptional regulator n=1 Tax=Nocardiopsis aegyptia TaxID=220378 RepID=UPI003670B832
MRPVQCDNERTLLRTLYGECTQGKSRIVQITGTTASGKSTLLNDFIGHVTASGGLHMPASGARSEQGLPLGLINQIMGAAALAPLSAGPQDGPDSPSPGLLALLAPRLEELCFTLRRLAADTPLVVHVDDAHLADAHSVRCLLYVLRRLRRTPVMAVTTARPPSPGGAADHLTELAWLPHCTRIRLAPIGETGARALLAEHLAEVDDETVADLLRTTGGLPGLIRAVLDDHFGAARRPLRSGTPPARLRPGASYRATFTEHLCRHEPSAMTLARKLAVLDEAGTLDTSLPRLLSHCGEAGTVLHGLRAAGLLDSDGFRCPEARDAVLDLMDPGERAETHLRCARLLHQYDAPIDQVARHLCAVEDTSDPWAVPLLCTAAEQAMGRGDVAFAIDCLTSASALCTDEESRPRIGLALAATQWRMDPEAATRHLLRHSGHARAGRLSACELYALLRGLLWTGHHTRAEGILRDLPETVRGATDPDSVVEARITRAVFASTYPELTALVPAPDGHEGTRRIPSVSTPLLRLKGAESLTGALRVPGVRPVAIGAEEVLTNAGFGEHMVEAVFAALSALIYTDQLDRAVYWCEALLGASDRSPLWSGQAHMLRADVALRTGDLDTARHHARAALSSLSAPGWGTTIALPLSILLLVAQARGDHREAARITAEPVPEEAFRSRFGLHYLYARGHHHLGAGRAQSALADFSACGDLMGRWDLDSPSLVPWRGGAARALRRLGDPGTARRLVLEQEELVGPDRLRTRGIVLRDLATALSPRERVPVLEEAVRVLDRAPDALEASRARRDLAGARESLEDGAGAAGPPQPARHGTLVVQRSAPPELTRAESRVAVLAAKGLTNRQISSSLHITVSTVEQHLTRIYRKFDITDRQRITDVLPLVRDMAR